MLFYVVLNADMLLTDLVPKSTRGSMYCHSVISGLKFWDLDA